MEGVIEDGAKRVINQFSTGKRYTIQQYKRSSSYKVVMYTQKSHHFCDTSSPDDGPKLDRKYFGNNWLWKVYQPILVEYHKINTAIRKD